MQKQAVSQKQSARGGAEASQTASGKQSGGFMKARQTGCTSSHIVASDGNGVLKNDPYESRQPMEPTLWKRAK